ncbi:MAG: methyltransferase domain-containing protein [Pseudomonadota bacterium]
MTSLIQKKFGEAASDYASCAIHAEGPSLARLKELIDPQPTWRQLDIATGAGHTALAFAPHIAKSTASDITPEMLIEVKRLAKERGLKNVVTRRAQAGDLPFPDTSFHLVTCRLAAHHFLRPKDFVAEAARVMIPGGIFALVDNVSPSDAALAESYNSFEKLRDPSHVRALSLNDWCELIDEAGLELQSAEVLDKDIGFEAWTQRMRCSDTTTARLREMLDGDALAELLRPRDEADGLTFTLREAIVLAAKPGDLGRTAPKP